MNILCPQTYVPQSSVNLSISFFSRKDKSNKNSVHKLFDQHEEYLSPQNPQNQYRETSESTYCGNKPAQKNKKNNFSNTSTIPPSHQKSYDKNEH